MVNINVFVAEPDLRYHNNLTKYSVEFPDFHIINYNFQAG
jgi:hypothetical protein